MLNYQTIYKYIETNQFLIVIFSTKIGIIIRHAPDQDEDHGGFWNNTSYVASQSTYLHVFLQHFVGGLAPQNKVRVKKHSRNGQVINSFYGIKSMISSSTETCKNIINNLQEIRWLITLKIHNKEPFSLTWNLASSWWSMYASNSSCLIRATNNACSKKKEAHKKIVYNKEMQAFLKIF